MNLPPDIKSGHLRAYFVFDVADSILLTAIKSHEGKEFTQAQLKLADVPAPDYLQFAVAPLVAFLPDIEWLGEKGEVRVKLYDYGTVALRFSFPYSGTWSEFAAQSRKMRFADELQTLARSKVTGIISALQSSLIRPHKELLEDYFIAEVREFDGEMTAARLLDDYRSALAALVCVEEKPLSPLQEEEALKECFSYCQSELSVLTWDQAFVFDDSDGADTVDGIIEFANTQLVELRTYDARLDRHLDEIYKSKAERMRYNWLTGRRIAERQAERLRHLLVDVRELSDRASNAIKIIGCAYYARLYHGIAARLSLRDWQHQVETKLDSVGEIYRFANDQAEHARSEFLEYIIIFLIALELVVGLLGRH